MTVLGCSLTLLGASAMRHSRRRERGRHADDGTPRIRRGPTRRRQVKVMPDLGRREVTP